MAADQSRPAGGLEIEINQRYSDAGCARVGWPGQSVELWFAHWPATATLSWQPYDQPDLSLYIPYSRAECDQVPCGEGVFLVTRVTPKGGFQPTPEQLERILSAVAKIVPAEHVATCASAVRKRLCKRLDVA